MATFFCATCRSELGYSREVSTARLLQSDYQRVKHQKHTDIDPDEHLQSVFRDPSTSSIRQHQERALLEGPMEVDDNSRTNFLCLSGDGTGMRYESGIPIESQDVTRVVLSSSAQRVHAFPESSARLGHPRCVRCGVEIFGVTIAD